ncbi:MAG: thioredoxin domain-containing protein [Gammaproteobacteria bacterium]|nr:thioredoxin domain-containing protein [Gammaproteobacteria bacterium]
MPYFKKSADLGDKVGANNFKYVSQQIRLRKQWKEGDQNELSVSISLNPKAPRLIIFQSLGCIHCARFVKKHLYWLKEAVAAEKLSLRIVDIHWGFSGYLGKMSRYLSCISEEKSNREYLSALFSFSNYIVTKTDGKTPDTEKLSDKITRRVLDGAFKRIRKKYQSVSESCLNKDGSEKTKKLNEAVKKLKIKKVPAYHFAGQLYSRDQFPILKKRIMEAMR